jgi:hypothetical protein
VYLPLAAVCFSFVLTITLPHLFAVVRAFTERQSELSRFTLTLSAAPMVMAVTSMVVVVSPQHWEFAFLLGTLYEVLALSTYFRMLRVLLAVVGNGMSELELLRKGDAWKIWAGPPLCCLWPFVSKRDIKDSDLKTARLMILQLVLVVPVTAIIDAFHLLPAVVGRGLRVLEGLSIMAAFWAVLLMLLATEQVVHDQRLHLKFWSVKGALIAHTASLRICQSTLDIPCIHALGGCYSVEAQQAALAATISLAILVPLAVLTKMGYPAGEPVQLLYNFDRVSVADDDSSRHSLHTELSTLLDDRGHRLDSVHGDSGI